MSLVGFYIVQQELAEEAVQKVRLERQIRDLKQRTAVIRAQLSGGRLVEARPRGGAFRRISFEQAMQRVEKTHPKTAAKMRAARKQGN